MRIETERLIITELTMEMARDVQENSLDEDNRRFVPDEVFETPEEARETVAFLISRYAGTEGPLVYAALTRQDNKYIGYVQLVPMGDGTWEIGYHIGKSYTGKGYATEAVRAFLPVMADSVGVSEVLGICVRENAASHRVLEKCGFDIQYIGPGPYQGAQREIVRGLWKRNGHEPKERAFQIRGERLTATEYIDFLKRTDLGSQYPLERFEARIPRLLESVSISLSARDREGRLIGALLGLTDFAYWLFVTDLGVDRSRTRQGIGKALMKAALEAAGGEKDIAIYLVANENAVPFYEKLGMKKSDNVMQYNHIEWTEFTVE